MVDTHSGDGLPSRSLVKPDRDWNYSGAVSPWISSGDVEKERYNVGEGIFHNCVI